MMYLHIPGLLQTEQLEQLDTLIADASFAEGNRNAGTLAKAIKKNLEMDREKTEKARDIEQAVLDTVWRNSLLRAAAMPVKITVPTINKHDEGMSYGPHIDSPVTGRAPAVRADLALSVFLTSPEDYEGGALSIRSEVGEIKFRLPKGDAIIYPAGVQHAIEEVTKGSRVAAVLWMQSIVADVAKRQILFDIDRATAMIGDKTPEAEEVRLLLKAHGNLMRMWGTV